MPRPLSLRRSPSRGLWVQVQTDRLQSTEGLAVFHAEPHGKWPFWRRDPTTVSWNRKCLRVAAMLLAILLSLPTRAKFLMLHLCEYLLVIRTKCCRWE